MDSATGKIIALEGDTQSISVQLSLLPPSQKILILPPLAQAANDSNNFDARKFVHDVHKTFTERIQTARAFLQSSTSAHRRLVFLNGGTISARATCIEKISESLTNGELEAAETIFNELVKDGVSGLMRENNRADGTERTSAVEPAADTDVVDVDGPISNTTTNVNSPEHDLVQPSNTHKPASQLLHKGSANNVGNFLSHRSDSDPGKRPTSIHDSEPARIPTSIFTTREGDHIIHTVLEIPVRTRNLPFQDPKVVLEKRSTFGPRDSAHTPNTQYHNALSHQSEESEEEDGLEDIEISAGEDVISTPETPAVVFGEAFLIDMQSASPTKSIKRARSHDRFFPTPEASQGLFLAPPQLKHTASAYSLRKRSSVRSVSGTKQKRYSKFPTTPRSTFVKASQTTIKRSPTLNGSMRTESNSSNERPKISSSKKYVDRGTDSGESEDIKIWNFEPVLPAMEDMIIHILDDSPRPVIELVVQSFRSGKHHNYRSSPSLASMPDSPTSEYSSIDPQYFDGKQAIRPSSYQAMVASDNISETTYDFDGNTAMKPWSSQFNKRDSRLEPPTPVPTPPYMPFIADRIFDLAPPISPSSVLSIHNSLRQFLSVHLPSGGGYAQHYYPVAPEAERLWKPVFGNDECSSIGDGGKTVDQIVALGCEAGVSREYFYQLSGQIERLGTKRDGLNRSGKVDIRYLIGSAMQTQPMLALSNESSPTPFTDANTLAAYLVPQLEAFLAANPNTRLLVLQYQASHLAVVLALQKILGDSIMKVTGILDSLASDPPSFSSLRGPASQPSIQSLAERWREHASNSKFHSLLQRSQTDPTVETRKDSDSQHSSNPPMASFSRANYLLSSTATDAEITNFLSSIWKCLMEKSAFYTPEVEVRSSRFNQARPPTPTSATRPTHEHPARDSSYPPGMQRPSASKMHRITGMSSNGPVSTFDSRSVRSARSTIPRSPSPVRSTRTTQSQPQLQSRQRSQSRASAKRTHHESMPAVPPPPVPKIAAPPNTSERRVMLGTDKDKDRTSEKTWDNFYIGEDDSDDDEMDRKMMGREMARIVPEERKVSMDSVQVAPPRNKKKALKWLGLA